MDGRNLLRYYVEIEKLKRTQRFASCKEDLRESTADHCWKLALLVIDVAERYNIDVDVKRAVKLALMHDLCEYQGDQDFDSYHVLTGVRSEQDKKEFERKAVEHLRHEYGRNDVFDIWMEFEDCKTRESRYVKALDRMEPMIHCIDFDGRLAENRPNGVDHQLRYADDKVEKFPELKPFLNEIKKKLIQIYKDQGHEINNRDYLENP